MNGFLATVTLVGSVAVFWGALVFIWPAAARIKFVAALEHARDDCEDAVLAGVLPDADCTRHFIKKADVFKYQAKRLSITSVAAMIVAFGKEDLARLPDRPSYSELTPLQRSQMHQFDARVTQAISEYLVNGSRFWPVVRPALWLTRRVLRFASRTKSRAHVYARQIPVVAEDTRPDHLALELQRLADDGDPFKVNSSTPLRGAWSLGL